jgi:hypothetical protein
VQAQGHRLTEILGNVRLDVPPWQRRYSWGNENWKAMWQSVSEVADARSSAEHFLGALVFQLGKEKPGMTVQRRIIDGQQRLITVSLVLAGIQRRLESYPSTEKRRREIDQIEGLLTNPGAPLPDSVKVVPYGDDLNIFLKCLRGEEIEESSALTDANEFFNTKLSGVSEARLIKLRDGMAGRFFFAAVYLDDQDDANRIFRSLNETGLTLAPTDHIRNNLFMSAGVSGDALYITHWEPLERLFGSNDALLSFLFAEQARQEHTPNTIRKKELHRVYATEFQTFSGRPKKMGTYLGTLRKNGTVFKALSEPKLLEKCDLPNAAKLEAPVARLAEWGSQPAEIAMLDVLVGYRDGELQLSQATRSLHLIESFLVRRFLGGEKANLLSRIFTDLVAQFPESGTYSTRLRAALSSPGHAWPTNQEVHRSVDAVLNFYVQGSGPQRRYVLKELNGHKLEGKTLKNDEIPLSWPPDMTIEHVMPQSLTKWWRDLIEAERKARGWDETVDELHEAHVNLLGNLTLAKQSRNVQYGNKDYAEKVALINQNLPLQLNRQLGTGAYKSWGIEAIRKRSEELATLACAIWDGPSSR